MQHRMLMVSRQFCIVSKIDFDKMLEENFGEIFEEYRFLLPRFQKVAEPSWKRIQIVLA